ncbi:MAG: hypothetical protein QNK23_10185 [Crocinitomicaceae bacterium]|nr:hypothetical protein [Crocinitomicaceae bacterium]
MKHIIPVTIALLLVIIVAQFLPYFQYTRSDWTRSGPDLIGFDTVGWYIIIPSFALGALLIVRNRVAAVIGSVLSLPFFFYASYRIINLYSRYWTGDYLGDTQIGPSPIVSYFGITAMTVVSIIHVISIKKNKEKERHDSVLDDLL